MSNSNVIDEGYVKYSCQHTFGPAPDRAVVDELNKWREVMRRFNLIGMYPDGIGFGNISSRSDAGTSFVISGTATGGIERLGPEHYTFVSSCDVASNTVYCSGPIQPSSEAMTHFAVYAADSSARSVIHVHHEALWCSMLEDAPTTKAAVPYGTPEMANEVMRLFEETDVKQRKFFAMAGHREGIVAFGSALKEAGKVIIGEANRRLGWGVAKLL